MRALLCGLVAFDLAFYLVLSLAPRDPVVFDAAAGEPLPVVPLPAPPPFREYLTCALWIDRAEQNEGLRGWTPDTVQEWHHRSTSNGTAIQVSIQGSDGRLHSYHFRFSPEGKLLRLSRDWPQDLKMTLYPPVPRSVNEDFRRPLPGHDLRYHHRRGDRGEGAHEVGPRVEQF